MAELLRKVAPPLLGSCLEMQRKMVKRLSHVGSQDTEGLSRHRANRYLCQFEISGEICSRRSLTGYKNETGFPGKIAATRYLSPVSCCGQAEISGEAKAASSVKKREQQRTAYRKSGSLVSTGEAFTHNHQEETPMPRETDYFKSFCKISKAFGTAAGRDELLKLIVESAITSMDGKAACLFLEDKRQDIFVVVAQAGLSDKYLHANPIKAAKLVAALDEKGYLAFPDATSDPKLENHQAKKNEGIASILTVPVRLRTGISAYFPFIQPLGASLVWKRSSFYVHWLIRAASLSKTTDCTGECKKMPCFFWSWRPASIPPWILARS